MAALFRGIFFPFQKGALSFPRPVEDDELVRQSIIQIVLTARGERVMRSGFGSNIYSFIFENNDDVLAELIRTELMTAIGRYEPRAIVTDIQVTQDENQVTVDIFYVVVATKQEDRATIEVKV